MTRRQWLRAVAGLAFAALIGTGYAIHVTNVRSESVQLVREAMRCSGKPTADCLALLSPHAAEAMRKYDQEFGPVDTFDVVQVVNGPVGIPVEVRVEVRRGGNLRQEGLYRTGQAPIITVWSVAED